MSYREPELIEYKSRSMTIEQIRKKLGFIPFDEFEYDQLLNLKSNRPYAADKASAIKNRFRQTGRTTRILCNALSRISNGQDIYFKGNSHFSTAMLILKLKEYAELLNLDTTLIHKFDDNSSLQATIYDHQWS